jgi:hypothetical protein
MQEQARRLPKRDYFLLPLISLLTVVCIFGLTETASRQLWPKAVWDSCFYWDGDYGPRDRPNCTSDERIPESPLTHNVFNACGYRTLDSCGPKAAGTIRVVVLGSSVAEGLLVPMNETAGFLATRQLEAACGKPVQFEQLTAPLQSPVHARNRMPEALQLAPDAIVFALTPIDIEALTWYRDQLRVPEKVAGQGPAHQTLRNRLGEYANRLQDTLVNSQTVFTVEHFLFRDPSLFLRMYLLYGDKADFLRQPFTEAWQRRFADLDYLIGNMSKQAEVAGVPFFVAAVPSRANAALFDSSLHDSHLSPFAWGQEIAKIAGRHGARYIDALRAYSATLRSDLLYYAVDGHMKPEGQPILAEVITRALLQSGVPRFNACKVEVRQSSPGEARTTSLQ